AQARRRWFTLGTVVIPTIGLVVAIVGPWNRAIDAVELASFLVMYTLTVVGIGTGFHRLITHRSFSVAVPLRIVFAILGSMAAQGPVLFWAAVHRRHHAHSDQEGDPHSPYLQRGS